MRGETNCESVIQVRVVPKSSKNQILIEEEGGYKVKLTAAPVEGKANTALKQLLSKRLGVPKKSVEIVSGERARLKSIRIQGLSAENVNNLLKKEP
jgi:uncharacterized protein (TIGR00251 family)